MYLFAIGLIIVFWTERLILPLWFWGFLIMIAILVGL